MLSWMRRTRWRTLCRWGGSEHHGRGDSTEMKTMGTHFERVRYRVDTCFLMAMTEVEKD